MGICLTLGYLQVAAGASLLFSTNVVAIVLGAGVSFFFAGVRGNQNAADGWSKRMGSIFLMILIGLVIPLSSVFMRQKDCRELEFRLEKILNQDDMRITEARLGEHKRGVALLELKVETPKMLSEEKNRELALEAKSYMKRDVRLEIETVLVVESHR